MITAPAPASAALRAFTTKSHVPRWTSAMLPGVKPAKSSGSQPASEELGSGPGGNWLSSAPSTGASTSPLPEYSIVKKSSS
jgi:hypothetical protein